jgi:hypothetical protein
MSRRSRERRGLTLHRSLVKNILPDPNAVLLLRALLWTEERARTPWSAWAQAQGDLKNYFKDERWGQNGLLPLLSRQARLHSLEVKPDFAASLRAAALREKLRFQALEAILFDVHDRWVDSGVEALLIGGAAHAYTLYDDPADRHTHGIEWLTRVEQTSLARELLLKTRFERVPTQRGRPPQLEKFTHESGLELTLRTQLFAVPHVESDPEGVFARSDTLDRGGHLLQIPGILDRLSHSLIETATTWEGSNLRWACDAYKLLQTLRTGPSSELDSIAEAAGVRHVPAFFATVLEFLRSELDAPLHNGGHVHPLDESVSIADQEIQFLLSANVRTARSRPEFMRMHAVTDRSFWLLLRFLLCPTREHLYYETGTLHSLPVLHAVRWSGYLRRAYQRRKTLHSKRSSSDNPSRE